MRGRDFTKAERALQVIAAMAGVDIAELNKALEEDQEFLATKAKEDALRREVPQSSFTMLQKSYVDESWDPKRMWEHCTKPQPLGKLDD